MAKKTKQDTMLQYVLIGVACLLLVISVVETVQISTLKTRVVGGTVSQPIAQQGAAPATTPASPSVAQPTMVGGC